MGTLENTRRDILLIITTALIILFITNLAAEPVIPAEPIIIPEG